MRAAMTGAVLALGISLPGGVLAKPALRDVPQIDAQLFAIGLAHEIRENCPTISARLFRALGVLRDLQREAASLGYSESEIRTHIESDTEKDRLRARAADYMAARNLGQDEQGYCALGQAEIAQNSQIGALLRASD
ncbi:DUF5333 domain-containing protein [Roseobacter weihaiensis]|uniref:DUF5333 domain-containing protein n=1 Tax=Roseobacter weihaiensis TaxID=2763262 RepID=UPI001D0BBB8A|nr:DUF5333 domain-containing protein [Roseobacter sp. H9]